MAELQDWTIDRWVTDDDALYESELMTHYMTHASMWRHVVNEINETTAYRRVDTTVDDIQPESWDEECNVVAA